MEQIKVFIEKAKTDSELSEADLDAVSGGATQNRYDASRCRGLTETGAECMGFLGMYWCDHYRREKTAKDDDYVYYDIGCAMGCFKYIYKQSRDSGYLT